MNACRLTLELVILYVLSLLSSQAVAADRYYVGPGIGVNANWNNPANGSATLNTLVFSIESFGGYGGATFQQSGGVHTVGSAGGFPSNS
jgi:hypothetical protein